VIRKKKSQVQINLCVSLVLILPTIVGYIAIFTVILLGQESDQIESWLRRGAKLKSKCESTSTAPPNWKQI
jgi:hypothetical protein